MFSQKIFAPVDVLFDPGYKLSYFCEDLSKYVENQLKSGKKEYKVSKRFKTWFKNDIFHVEMLEAFCPECFTRSVIKKGVKGRKLIFYDKKKIKTEIQAYKCNKCTKKFNKDISEIIDDNSNFTYDFKSKCIELVGLFFESLRNVAYKVKKDTGIHISDQKIENWILEYKNKKKDYKNRYSGYYIFVVEWVKIKGVWNYRFTLIDSKQDIIFADEIYSKENSKNIKEFLEQNTRNKNKIAITTDLDEKYKPIIEELGFKHQWCLFHTFKNFNKIIKKHIKQNKVSKKEIKKIQEVKQEIFSLFETDSLKNARDKIKQFLTKIKEYSKVIKSIIIKSLRLTLKLSSRS